MHMFVVGEYMNKNGEIKKKLKVCFPNVIELFKIKTLDNWFFVQDVQSYSDKEQLLAWKQHFHGYEIEHYTEYYEVRCGKCLDCRLAAARDWCARCMLELKSHSSAYFITLTYNDRFCPPVNCPDKHRSLDKKGLQRFFKRLRQHFPNDNIRYYACGEYGGKTFRPHYHCIIFGLHLDDLTYYKTTKLGDRLYLSPKLERVWSEYDKKTGCFYPLGYVVIGEVTYDSISYTCRYVMKKQDKSAAVMKHYYENILGIEPEFTVMSNRPGLGYDYFLKNYEEIYKYDYINVSTLKGGKQLPIPHYFDYLVKKLKLPHVDIEAVQERRRNKAMAVDDAKQHLTTLPRLDRLKMESGAHRSRTKILKLMRHSDAMLNKGVISTA